MSEQKQYECSNCNIYFYPTYTYDNPMFLADEVADCPKCGGKCWERNS
jgi:DNA-directed RNA polymerase subunit RPC12/RpoP